MASYLLSFILILSTLLAVAKGVSIAIDCGFTGDTYEDDNKINWTGDEDGAENSEIISIPGNSVDETMRTLRVFSKNEKKNCYTVEADKDDKVMICASFYYGNYDKKWSPPSFDLEFDGNYWVNVETSLDEVVTYEAIYVTTTPSVSVCVAQSSPNQFPFMSALQIQSLDSKMYANASPDKALFSIARLAFGSKYTIRYPQDSYDRIWTSAPGSNGLIDISNDGSSVDVSRLPDNPPSEVFQNAVTTADTSVSISLSFILPSDPTLLHINMYFAEIQQLDITESRTFQLRVNNADLGSPIVPDYKVANELYVTELTASSKTSFVLEATSNSSFPPLLNALEVFLVSDTLLSNVSYNADGLCVSGKSCKVVRTDSEGSSAKKKSSNLGIILGVLIPLFVLVWVAIGVFVLCRQKKKKNLALMQGQNLQNLGGQQGTGGFGQEMMDEVRVNMNDGTTNDTSDQNQQGGDEIVHTDLFD